MKTWLLSYILKQNHSELLSSSILMTDLQNFFNSSNEKFLSNVIMSFKTSMYWFIDSRISTESQNLWVYFVLLSTFIKINRKTDNLILNQLDDINDHIMKLNKLSIFQHSLRSLHLNSMLLDWRKLLFSFLLMRLSVLRSIIIRQKLWESVNVLVKRNVYLKVNKKTAWLTIMQWCCMTQIKTCVLSICKAILHWTTSVQCQIISYSSLDKSNW